jgi:hypothetical protein
MSTNVISITERLKINQLVSNREKYLTIAKYILDNGCSDFDSYIKECLTRCSDLDEASDNDILVFLIRSYMCAIIVSVDKYFNSLHDRPQFLYDKVVSYTRYGSAISMSLCINHMEYCDSLCTKERLDTKFIRDSFKSISTNFSTYLKLYSDNKFNGVDNKTKIYTIDIFISYIMFILSVNRLTNISSITHDDYLNNMLWTNIVARFIPIFRDLINLEDLKK